MIKTKRVSNCDTAALSRQPQSSKSVATLPAGKKRRFKGVSSALWIFTALTSGVAGAASVVLGSLFVLVMVALPIFLATLFITAILANIPEAAGSTQESMPTEQDASFDEEWDDDEIKDSWEGYKRVTACDDWSDRFVL